ncbi:transposable element Tcb2 transposase [Trichonephila clavipes]|nr:transposable element Tcb2 transposase [Trichonephila clavipes]
MIWAGISIGGPTDMHIIQNGNFVAQIYANEILRPRVIPCAATFGDSFLLMQDNVRNPTVRLVKNFLEIEAIQRMEWPACSPGLNLIQHAWDSFG